jgi:HEPN domain-containing protein
MNDALVREWVHKAEHDREAVLALQHRRRKPIHDVVCFHAQQCAEKYLKAFLTSLDSAFGKTYDLEELCLQAMKHDGTFALVKDLAHVLTPYAVPVRYPGEEPGRKQANHAVKSMLKIRAFVRSKLRKP